MRRAFASLAVFSVLLVVTPFAAADSPMDLKALADFAERYAAAWSSQDPELMASFYSPEGTLTVNEGEPSVRREAIAAKARAFMEAFPDMIVELRAVQETLNGAEFHWFWTGTNTGPGARTGRWRLPATRNGPSALTA